MRIPMGNLAFGLSKSRVLWALSVFAPVFTLVTSLGLQSAHSSVTPSPAASPSTDCPRMLNDTSLAHTLFPGVAGAFVFPFNFPASGTQDIRIPVGTTPSKLAFLMGRRLILFGGNLPSAANPVTTSTSAEYKITVRKYPAEPGDAQYDSFKVEIRQERFLRTLLGLRDVVELPETGEWTGGLIWKLDYREILKKRRNSRLHPSARNESVSADWTGLTNMNMGRLGAMLFTDKHGYEHFLYLYNAGGMLASINGTTVVGLEAPVSMNDAYLSGSAYVNDIWAAQGHPGTPGGDSFTLRDVLISAPESR